MNRTLASSRTAFIFFVLCSSGFAASKEDELRRDVRVAKALILGEVDRVYSYYGDDGEIYSNITLRVGATLKQNRETASVISFTAPGGEVGDIGVRLKNLPHFDPGEPVLVFLAEASTGALTATAKYLMNQERITGFDKTPLEFLLLIRQELDEIGEAVSDREWERSTSFVSRSLQPGRNRASPLNEMAHLLAFHLEIISRVNAVRRNTRYPFGNLDSRLFECGNLVGIV